MLASPKTHKKKKKKKEDKKEKEKEEWSDLSVSYMSPTVSANAQFWLHTAHIPCMQSLLLFLEFFVRAAACLRYCHFQFCCFFNRESESLARK
jgi:hypothetical protein